MAFRTGHTTSLAGVGTINRKTRTFTGKGKAPVGARKVKAPRASEVPTVTTSPTGRVSTAGFPTPHAAVQAKQRSQAARRRVSRIEAQQTSALAFHRRSQQRASQTTPQPSIAALSKRNTPMTTKTVISSKALGGTIKKADRPVPAERPPSYKPPKFQGAKTAGTPSLKELQVAAKHGTLRTNRKGVVTTPAVRRVSSNLKRARQAAARSQPLLKGLSPAERSVVPLVRKAHRKYPDIPKSVMMAQIKQESGFNPAAVSSAGAQGLTQFIPSTAASYGVRYGTGRKEQQSQVTGQAKLLHSDNFAQDPQGALSAYSGGYAAGDYNNPILEDAKASYGGLDKPGNPKAVQQLRVAKAKARKLGLQVANPRNVRPAPKKVVTRFKAIKKAAAALTKRHIPYVWGGGHGSIESAPSGLDCSGAVSWVLNKAGILKTPLTSGSMGEVLKPGPGAVTVFYNAGHTFMKIGNEYWGTSVGDSGAGGLGPHPAPSASYLAQYSVGHVPGLGKKQALQLGLSPTSSTSFPGMTLSSSGTTATIQPSAGTTQAKPGFSKSPIKLTQAQKAHRTLKELASLGAGVGPKAEASSEDKGAILASLEQTYGKKAA